jgi:hypothetical protein
MVTQRDYNETAVNAAHSVLLEILHVLGEYRDEIVLVGGWVPLFLCTSPKKPHIGSIDIDLALDHRKITQAGYRSILQLLLERGCKQGSQPFIFHREVPVADRCIRVEVDLLAGVYSGTGESHRIQSIQDIQVRKARGADLAFDSPVEIVVEGMLPGGVRDSITLRVASIVPFIVMKSIALDSRLKEKDSWDIYYCICNYPGGVDAVVKAFAPYNRHKLVKDSLHRLEKHFSSVDSIGPTHVVDFEMITDTEERDRIRRDAFERIQYVLEKTGIIRSSRE